MEDGGITPNSRATFIDYLPFLMWALRIDILDPILLQPPLTPSLAAHHLNGSQDDGLSSLAINQLHPFGYRSDRPINNILSQFLFLHFHEESGGKI